MILLVLLVVPISIYYQIVCTQFLSHSDLDVETSIHVRRQQSSLNQVIYEITSANSTIRSMSAQQFTNWVIKNTGMKLEEEWNRYIWNNVTSIE